MLLIEFFRNSISFFFQKLKAFKKKPDFIICNRCFLVGTNKLDRFLDVLKKCFIWLFNCVKNIFKNEEILDGTF